VTAEAGTYRLRRRDDNLAFGHSAGPQSWKTYLHPPKALLWTVAREGFTVSEPPAEDTRYAFIGVRPCDLRAIAVQDRVLGRPGSRHADRRATTFIVAVDCTEPGQTCFCVSAGGGPACGSGADLRLTELADGAFLAQADTPPGAELLQRLAQRPATDGEVREGREAVACAADSMRRRLPSLDLKDLLSGTREAARWDDIAQRCLSCGNCTMVCPTCFCTTVTDTSDLTGQIAQRWQSWDSCFDLDFSYLHGGPVRTSTRSRYRQWLTHKLGTWHDQFGESGCVGCGRCIVWCPVGIDITAETQALAQEVSRDDQRA
jgi:ferredoxin